MCTPLDLTRAATSRATSSGLGLIHESLPNGFELPFAWPPTNLSYLDFISNPPRPYHEPPHVQQPPHTINIDVGRQLFVDDFLVESTTLQRRWHTAHIRTLGVLRPNRPWEAGGGGRLTARPFGGGSLLNPATQVLNLWYRCGWRGTAGRTCVATSLDGRHFEKPQLQHAGSGRRNNVVISTKAVEAFEVVYDAWASPPRYVALRMEWMTGGVRVGNYTVYSSPDGTRWRRIPNASPGVMADRSTFFINPLREKPTWVFSLRENLCAGGPSGHMRARRYWEAPHSLWPADAACCAGAAQAPSRTYARFVRSYFQCEVRREGEPVAWFGVDANDCGASAAVGPEAWGHGGMGAWRHGGMEAYDAGM